MKRAIIHIDGDGFFASVEIALNPKLKGKPVVTGFERGIATAMSPEAKALGIHRGMPVFKIKKLYPQAIVVSSNYKSYGIFAQRMYDIVRRFTDNVEEYSIDECFADISDLERKGFTHEDIARSIKETLHRELGVTFSVGLAPTKVLAKVASKWQKPDGFTIIENENIFEFLKSLEIGKVWGIGPASSADLQRLGINTAFDFVSRSIDWVRDNLSRPHLELWYELRGTPVYKTHVEDDAQKSIQSTRTFPKPSTDKEFIISELSRNVENVCIKARAEGAVARRIYYFLKTQEFRYQRFEIALTTAVQTPESVVRAILETFDALYDPQTIYRATGVTLAGLVPEGSAEIDLFGEVVKKRVWSDIFNIVDKIDKRYGEHSVTLASSMNANRVRGQHPAKHLIIPFMGEVA